MKTKYLTPIVCAFILPALNISFSTCLAQGSLTPPGPPGATMLTLSQVEPRTPVDAVHTPAAGFGEFAIQQPGSYYLTTNITGISGKDGIEVMTNHVTIDLNGFTMLGGGVDGIAIDAGANNVTVRNGTISGWDDGLDSSAPNTTVEHVKILNCNENGIYSFGTATPTFLRDCLCESNGLGSSYVAIHSAGGVISDCVVINNNVGTAIELNNGYGTVSGCTVSGNTGYGFYSQSPDWNIINNTCISNQSIAITINGSNNRIEGNYVVTTNGVPGIDVTGAEYINNVVVRNVVIGDGSGNYSNPGNNDFGPIGTAATATSPWANISH